MLDNYEAYYIYANLIRSNNVIIRSSDITINNWHDHYNGILNILRDGIETEFVQHMYITIDFGNNETVDLIITDYYLNLLLWYCIIALNDESIGPQHLFFKNSLTRKDIKNYIDKHFLIPRKLRVNNLILNNVIADTLQHFIDIDEFSMFLSNTLNLEDSIELMSVSKEYYDLLHADLSNTPLENVKDKGMELVQQAKAIIVKSVDLVGHEHCLRNAFVAKEGIHEGQYKDNSINIGTKPDGQGSIYHEIINKSYITGGLNDLMSQYIDSASARVAQIISKKNVGDSGGFARILKLNNVGTYLNPDPHFDCGTNNYVHITIPDETVFRLLQNRYYKLVENGPLLKIGSNDTFIIGREILLRSPMFCASHAHGNGVCYYCYGDLAYINNNISVGCLAAEILTEQYMQKRLSAKHLMEAKIKSILWNEYFENWFELNMNSISLKSDLIDSDEIRDWKLVLNLGKIQLEKDQDFYNPQFMGSDQDNPFYNEYVTNFTVMDPDGNTYNINASVDDDMEEENYNVKLYITSSLGDIIRNNISIDDDNDDIIIDFTEITGIPLFLIKMENNDLGRSLDIFDDLINKKSVTKQYTASELLEKLQVNILKGGITIDSVHLEVLLANQIRSEENKLLMPNWYNINEPYELLTLDEALSNNSSPIISLTYRRLGRMLTKPLSFARFSPSIFDPFFMRKPKKMLNVDHEVLDIPHNSNHKPMECPVIIDHDYKKKKHHPRDVKKFLEPFSFEENTELND